ncbi:MULTISPECIES: GNAT family N-acetyltransferase [unclassified Streptomyces]|jgi:RimJ/RimL family protein N-acetyltransferase|uniref:GNAT family N-acetyltransferase n=1 Tax=unclassified Streptomyces TaxID=2593676 RepID=UPI00081B6DE7|nr:MULTISPECIES: GNAT family N-acetyltransferase [unclassified Streptomyces]MYQ84005.1 GNAT family N-acetyltransferase [Streptomyces sp. SID4936]SCD77480.1 Protein N-acetyltransferase, RimJ/RimL family [Streptomyces sp. DvalAA-43]
MDDDPGTFTLSAGPLLLRPWLAEDAPALIEAHRDPTMRAMLLTRITDEAEAEQWLREQRRGRKSGSRFGFAVVDRDHGGALVGNVALKYPGPGSGSAEVGYWTAAPARGRGIAPLALGALGDWAFGAFAGDGLTRLELMHQVDNKASCRVAEKSGYGFAEVLPARPPWPRDGHRHVRLCAGGTRRTGKVLP